jgi:hypothetical protein
VRASSNANAEMARSIWMPPGVSFKNLNLVRDAEY